MTFMSLLKRGWNLAKVGEVVHKLRNASDESKKFWAITIWLRCWDNRAGFPPRWVR